MDAENTIWQTRATLAELLAVTFAVPAHELVVAMRTGEYAASVAEAAEALGVEVEENPMGGYFAQVDTEEERTQILRVEHTRLFVGSPKPVVSPYEGVWRAEADGVQALLFVNPHTMAVESFYHEHGVTGNAQHNNPLDNVSTELEFLSYLASLEAGIVPAPEGVQVPEGGWSASWDRFMDEHAKLWMPQFAAAVIDESCLPFYRVGAWLLAAFVQI